MDLMQRNGPLPVHAPTPPDHYVCHTLRGAQPIQPIDCQLAVETNWPSTHTYLRYYLSDPRPSDSQYIPSYVYVGSCRVALESAGPIEHLPHSMLLRPSNLRGLAGYLIQKCAVEGQGIGGYVTMGFSSALGFVHDSKNLSFAGNFLTISIEPRAHMGVQIVEPGSRDPNIAARLSSYMFGLGRARGEAGGKVYYELVARSLYNRALEMVDNYSANLTWWSKDERFSWWATRLRRRENSTTDSSESSSSNDSSVIGHTRPQISGLNNDTSGTGGSEYLGQTSGSGNGTVPVSLGDDSSDTGDDGDDEGSSGGVTPYAPASDGEGGGWSELEEMGAGQEDVARGLEDMDLDTGDMTYECDDNLGGGPSPVDCEKLAWSGLKPPDSVETLQPNVPQFYTQGTCGFVISSITPTTILWSHLIAAFQTLNMLCVQSPISKIKGGRAYYHQHRPNSWIHGKPKKKRDSGSTRVEPAEALPKGINATIFRHDASSDRSCEWVLAEEGKNLTDCRGA